MPITSSNQLKVAIIVQQGKVLDFIDSMSPPKTASRSSSSAQRDANQTGGRRFTHGATLTIRSLYVLVP
jgi:hypothetical protein